MKNLFLLLILILVSSFAPDLVEPFKITIPMVIAFVIGVVELVARLVPTVGSWAPLAIIINVLKWLSDYFNRKK
jgi:hypothetical protein